MRTRSLPSLFTTNFFTAALLVSALLLAGRAAAQQVTIATGLPSSASSGSSTAPSVVTFCINNARSTPVTLKGVDNYMSTSNANTVWKLYYSATSLSGQPNVTTWTLIDTVIGPTTVTTTGIYGLFSGLSFSIPASTTYRFALQTTASIINYGGSGVTPNSQTAANISLYRGDYAIGGSSVGYAGSASAPPFSPRFFCGTVYLDTAIARCAGTPSAPLITNTPFTTAAPLCSGSTTILNASDPNVGVGITYQWQSGPSATGPWTAVSGGSGATSLSYTTAPVTANTYFRLALTCTNSSITSYSTPFLVPVGSPQPGGISGLGTFCPGERATYSIPAVSGATYAWTLPPGWAGSSTSNSINVTPGPGTTAQTISVSITTPCGPTSIPRTRSIVPGSAPAAPGTIAGNRHICGNTPQIYSVLPVAGATSYIWTLPSGWTGASTSDTIRVTTNAASGTISVRAINGCGQSALSAMPVTVISSLAHPGRITGPDTVCSGALNTFSIAPVTGATSYVWTLPSGWSGTTSGTSIQAFAGTSSGTLQVVAYVSCAVSPVSDTDIVVGTTVSPSVSIAASAASLCQGTPVTITATPSFPGSAPRYQWTKNGMPLAASGSTFTSGSLAPGDSIAVIMTSNAACAATRTAVSNTLRLSIEPLVVPGVSINTVPPVVTCKGTPLLFTTTSTGTGPAPSYKWFKNGVELPGVTGTTYTDAALNDGDTMTIEMTTSATCPSKPTALSNKVGVRVNDPVTPAVTVSVSPGEVIDGNPKTFTATPVAGGDTPDFQWMRNGVAIPFERGATFTSGSLKAGDHITVQMLSYAPCLTGPVAVSNAIVLKSSLSAGGASAPAAGLNVYPNPGAGRFTISVTGWNPGPSGEQLRLDVINALGQPVHRVELAPVLRNGSWQTALDLDLPNGTYLLRLSGSAGGMQATAPFVLKR